MRKLRTATLNCHLYADYPAVVTETVEKLGQNYDSRWEAETTDDTSKWLLSCPDIPVSFILCPAEDESLGTVYDTYCADIRSRECNSENLCEWIGSKLLLLGKIDDLCKGLNASKNHLNAELSAESATRIKNVFRAAQQAVEFPKGFRYTAFRQNRSEDTILSTLEFASAKLGAKQWVIKSALSAAFTDEVEAGSSTGSTVDRDEWSFQPEYDPDGRGNDRGNDVRSSDRLFTFTPRLDTPLDPDKQATYWLVGILQNMIDDILDNPPNRVYEFFLAEGLLHKKNIAKMSDMGLIRLIKKGVVTGLEVLKSKPSLWKKLLEKDFITGEQAYKSQPSQLFWLTVHNYIPVERALKIDPSLESKLSKAGKLSQDDLPVTSTDVNSLIEDVKRGNITPQRAWSANRKVLKPLISENLITPQDAYKLDPSVLNWMLENHYIGRGEARRLKPGIEREMKRKGVDWESLDAGRHKTFHLGDSIRFIHPGGQLSNELGVIVGENPDGTFRIKWEDGDVSDGIESYDLILEESTDSWEDEIWSFEDPWDDGFESLDSTRGLNASESDTFYVSVNYGNLIIGLSKIGGKWEEELIYLDDEFREESGDFVPMSYMGYLSKFDVIGWIKQDYPGYPVREMSYRDVEEFLYE